jgi:hypothetical protein
MRGAVPPPPVRLHGVLSLKKAQGQLYLTFLILLQLL